MPPPVCRTRCSLLFPPCGGRMRSLSERSELRRSWMGGAAARTPGQTHQEAFAAAPFVAKDRRRRSCGGTPHPNLPPQGGKGLVEHVRSGGTTHRSLPPP